MVSYGQGAIAGIAQGLADKLSDSLNQDGSSVSHVEKRDGQGFVGHNICFGKIVEQREIPVGDTIQNYKAYEACVEIEIGSKTAIYFVAHKKARIDVVKKGFAELMTKIIPNTEDNWEDIWVHEVMVNEVSDNLVYKRIGGSLNKYLPQVSYGSDGQKDILRLF
nr:hypothetical protein BdHM001_10090 [Bdellovibrio sp. HM001]